MNGVIRMGIITYVLIGLYAVLSGIAGVMQWHEKEYPVQSFLFVAVSIGILITIYLPNRNWMFTCLILAFILLHLLAIVQGLLTNGELTYSHHIIRFIFHCVLILMVYYFIEK